MPWCEECEKYWTPTAMTSDGHCPQCGHEVETPTPPVDDTEDERAPWHFKLLVAALVVYLGWRGYQLVTGQL